MELQKSFTSSLSNQNLEPKVISGSICSKDMQIIKPKFLLVLTLLRYEGRYNRVDLTGPLPDNSLLPCVYLHMLQCAYRYTHLVTNYTALNRTQQRTVTGTLEDCRKSPTREGFFFEQLLSPFEPKYHVPTFQVTMTVFLIWPIKKN